MRLPAQRYLSLLDLLRFLTLVTLDRGMHQRGIDDLAATRQIILGQQLLLDLLECLIAHTSMRQAVTEQPDHLGVRDAAALGQIQKTQEAATI